MDPANPIHPIVQQILDEDPDVDIPEHPRQAYGGRYCCVVGCNNNQMRDIPKGIKFHRFPKKPSQREMWAKAVKRLDQSGRPWNPGNNDLICSVHFYGGKRSSMEGSPSYVPSIFPTHHIQPKTKADEDRFKRRQKFESARNSYTQKVIKFHCSVQSVWSFWSFLNRTKNVHDCFSG